MYFSHVIGSKTCHAFKDTRGIVYYPKIGAIFAQRKLSTQLVIWSVSLTVTFLLFVYIISFTCT